MEYISVSAFSTVEEDCVLLMSHKRISLSLLPDASTFPSGLKATAAMPSCGPFNTVAGALGSRRFQSLIVLSLPDRGSVLPDARVCPSGLIAMDVTRPRWPTSLIGVGFAEGPGV